MVSCGRPTRRFYGPTNDFARRFHARTAGYAREVYLIVGRTFQHLAADAFLQKFRSNPLGDSRNADHNSF